MSGPKQIPVIAPDGTPGTVESTSSARAVVEGGGRVMSPGEFQQAKQRAELESHFEDSAGGAIEGLIAPPLAGAARGLSLGLSDKLITRFGGDVARRRLLDYQEYQPYASVAGELGGIAAGALLGDEAALGAIPNAVSRLGMGAERLAMRGLGENFLGRGAGALVRGGVEGGVFGVGNAISESALHNTDLSGEAIVGGASHGALGGMIASGILHGAGRAFGALRRPGAEAYDAIAAQELGEAAPGLGKALAPEVEGLAGKARPHPEDVLTDGPYRRNGLADATADFIADRGGGENAAAMKEWWRTNRAMLTRSEEQLGKYTSDVTDAITAQQKASRVTDMATFGDAKVNHMSKLVSPSNFRGQLAVTDEFLTKAQAELAPLVGDANGGLTNKVVQQFDGHVSTIRAAAATGEGAKVNAALDDMKRWMGKEARFGQGPFGLSKSAETFDALYKDLQATLEHEVWGKAGVAQRAVNKATANHLAIAERFENNMISKYGNTLGRPDYVGDPEKVAAYFNKLAKPSNDLNAMATRDWISTRRAMLDATEANYDHGPAARAAIKAERVALDKMEAVFEKATKEVALTNQMKRLLADEQATQLGGTLGLIADTLTKPATTLRRLAQVQDQTAKVQAKIFGTSRALAGAPGAAAGTKGTGPGFFSTLLQSALPEQVKRAATTGAAATGSALNRGDFDKRSKAIAALQGNPQLLTRKVGDALAPIGEAAPKTTAAATMTAINGLAFLASKMPDSRQDPYSLTPQFRTASKASDSEIAQHMRYQEALDNPTIVLDKALSGTLTPDHVEAVKAVYPKLYEQMRQDIFTGLVEAKSPVPYGRRIQLGILLDLPTDQTLAPDFVSAIQATYAPASEPAGQEPPNPNLAALDVSSSLATATQAATEGLDR